jgi:alanine racemase
MVRAGIALYGISPGAALDQCAAELRPALSLRARVSHVKQVRAGDRISYGLRHRFDADTNVATLPLGYADGVPRLLFAAGGEVLISGRRRPIVGVVTMDQLMVDCGTDAVAVGDEAVLIGEQAGELITAIEWADRVGTISYEVVCGISARIDRRYSAA